MMNTIYHPCRIEHSMALESGGLVHEKDFAARVIQESSDEHDEECAIEVRAEKLERAEKSLAAYGKRVSRYENLRGLQGGTVRTA